MPKYARIKEHNSDELDGLTEGRWYKVTSAGGRGFYILDDNELGTYCRINYCAHLNSGSWELSDFDHDPNESEKPEWCERDPKTYNCGSVTNEAVCDGCVYHKQPLMTFFEAWQQAEEGALLKYKDGRELKKNKYEGFKLEDGYGLNQQCLFKKAWSIEPKSKPEPKSVNVVEIGGDCVSSFYGKCGKLEQLTLNVPNGISIAFTIKKIIIEYED